MSGVSRINSSVASSSSSRWDGFKKTAMSYAKIIDSRESTYRLALDLSAFDIPTLAAAAFRNFWNFLEAAWEAGIGTFMVFAAPHITTLVAKIASKFILETEEQKNADNYLRFQMDELESIQKMKEALKTRIKDHEPKDQRRVVQILSELKFTKAPEKHEQKAQDIEKFCNEFIPTDKHKEKIYKLKKAVILGESLIEGGVWGSFGLSLRWFRKYVLRKERFTGTMGYLGDAESSGLGEGSELNWFQKIGGVCTMFLSPTLNSILLKKTKDSKKIENSKLLSVASNHLDMTHSVYPKLGLLFTYTSVPKWIGLFITSQGWYERLERVFKFLTIIPSWWLGHRITNGILALKADKKLAKDFNVNPGILVEEEYLKPENTKGLKIMEKLKYLCPEPARIHHVLDRVEKDGANMDGNKKEEFRKEAEKLHAKTLYLGFALHSFLVWCITMLVNYTTKLRVKYDLNN